MRFLIICVIRKLKITDVVLIKRQLDSYDRHHHHHRYYSSPCMQPTSSRHAGRAGSRVHRCSNVRESDRVCLSRGETSFQPFPLTQATVLSNQRTALFTLTQLQAVTEENLSRTGTVRTCSQISPSCRNPTTQHKLTFLYSFT